MDERESGNKMDFISQFPIGSAMCSATTAPLARITSPARSSPLKRSIPLESVKLRYRPGDVIIQSEEPMVKAVSKDFIDRMCSWCMVPAKAYVLWPQPCCPLPKCAVEPADKIDRSACPTGEHAMRLPVPRYTESLTPCQGPCTGRAGWYCSEECRLTDWNSGHDMECSIIARYLSANSADYFMNIQVRLTLRLWIGFIRQPHLLHAPCWLATDGSQRSVLQFAHHTEKRMSQFPWFFERFPKLLDFENLLRPEQGFTADLAAQLLATVMTNVMSNQMTNYTVGPSDDAESGSALYGNACSFDHSCRPNANWIMDSRGRVTIRARQPILEGEQVTISYMQLDRMRQERQEHLKRVYNFDCECVRCVHHPEVAKVDLDARGSVLAQVMCGRFDECRETNEHGRLVMSYKEAGEHLSKVASAAYGEYKGMWSRASQLFNRRLSKGEALRLSIRSLIEGLNWLSEQFFPDDGNTEELEVRYYAVLAATDGLDQDDQGKRRKVSRDQMITAISRHYYAGGEGDVLIRAGKMIVEALKAHVDIRAARAGSDEYIAQAPMNNWQAIKQQLELEESGLDQTSEQEIDEWLDWIKEREHGIAVVRGEESDQYARFQACVVQPVRQLQMSVIGEL